MKDVKGWANDATTVWKKGILFKIAQGKNHAFIVKNAKVHHSSLCDVKYGRSREHGNIAAEGNDQCDSDTESVTENESALLAAGEQVVLQTAQVQVNSAPTVADRDWTISTRMLFDSGANRSYCTQALATKLGLKTKIGPSLQVNRFGTGKPTSIPTKTAELCLRKANRKTVTIEVSVIPTITGDIVRVPVQSKRLDKLKQTLQLADTVPHRHESSPIGLLIGSDYYLDFVSGEKVQLGKGLYLLSSDFRVDCSGSYTR